MKILKQTSTAKLLQLMAGVGIIWIGLAECGKTGPAEDYKLEEITKELQALHDSTRIFLGTTDCEKIDEDILRAEALAGKKYFSDREIQFFKENCNKKNQPSPTNRATKPSLLPKVAPPASKTAGQIHMPKPEASESSDMHMKVTSALNALAEQPADKKNCNQRMQLIETFDKLAEIDGSTTYSIEERNYFLKPCFSILPQATPFTHKIQKPPVPTGFMGELQGKLKQRQDRDANIADLDNLLAELDVEKQKR